MSNASIDLALLDDILLTSRAANEAQKKQIAIFLETCIGGNNKDLHEAMADGLKSPEKNTEGLKIAAAISLRTVSSTEIFAEDFIEKVDQLYNKIKQKETLSDAEFKMLSIVYALASLKDHIDTMAKTGVHAVSSLCTDLAKRVEHCYQKAQSLGLNNGFLSPTKPGLFNNQQSLLGYFSGLVGPGFQPAMTNNHPRLGK